DNSFVGGASIGEELHASLRDMEKSYLATTVRPKEQLIKISVANLNPIALLAFRKTGKMNVTLPEWYLLNLNPAIYHAKWISLSVSIPMITGPNIAMSVVVKQDMNFIRVKSDGVPDARSFAMTGPEDKRFVQNNTPFDQIIVGMGINDQGYNLDPAASSNEIYQNQQPPFYGSGFIGEYNIHVNSKTKDFDFTPVNLDTVRDVMITGVLSVELDEGDYMIAAQKYLTSLFSEIKDQVLSLFLDIKHDLANEF